MVACVSMEAIPKTIVVNRKILGGPKPQDPRSMGHAIPFWCRWDGVMPKWQAWDPRVLRNARNQYNNAGDH